MKKILIFLILLALVKSCGAAAAFTDSIEVSRTWLNGFAWTGHVPKDKAFRWGKEVENKLDGDTAINNFLFEESTSDPTSTEGRMYYNTNSSAFKFYNGSDWITFGTSAGGDSLDTAYNNGNTIDVDGSAVTLDNDTTDNNVLLILTQDDTTGNTDAMTIVNTNTGDAIQISPGATTGGGVNIIGKASGTTPLITLNSTTNNMNLADNVGQILITSDVAYAHKGAGGLVVYHQTGQPVTAAEGFLARFVSTGTARADSYAVGITVPATQPAMAINSQVIITGQDNSSLTTLSIVGNDGTNNTDAVDIHNEGTGDCLQITPDDTGTVALNIVGKANSTVTVVHIDGDTGDWIGGADDVAMVEIVGGATANADAGGGLLAVISGTTPKANSEGYLCRFISTGTATTTAHAVEIETTNTQPALMLNNQLTITGVDSTGVLVAITGNDDTGDTDVMTIANGAASDGIQITNSDVSSVAIRAIATASQITSSLVLDGATNNWDGADNVGMLHLTHDDAAIDGGATLLMCLNSGTMKAAAEGYLARFVQVTGAAVTDAYAVEIETTATSPCLKLNGQMSIAGQGATDGVLLDIVSADTDDDTVQLTGVGAGDVLQITPNAVTAIGINVVAKASGTTADVYIDATAGWIGASDVGLVSIVSDSALTDAAATLLLVKNATGQVKADAQGHLARFVDAAAARTGAHAVEIKTTNTTPCLLLNNKLTITGADSAGTLVAITGADVAGDSDTFTMTHRGDASALKITTSEPAGTAIEVVCDAAQTGAAVMIDATTGAWVGKAAEGILEIANDGTAADTTASMIYLAQSGTNISGQEGICLNMIDTSASGGGTEYVMHIDSTNNEAIYVDSGEVLIDEFLTATGGVQVGVGETMTTAAAEGASGTIDDGVTFANVTTTTGVNEFITLPNDPPVGTVVYVMNNVGANFEIRTLAAGNDSINNIDTSDAATEYLCTSGGANNGDLVCFTYVTADRWIGVSYTYLGAVRTAVIPD